MIGNVSHQHVLGALHWLESHEGHLHGEDCAKTVESAVGHVDPGTEPARDHQRENVQRYQVDKEDITTP